METVEISCVNSLLFLSLLTVLSTKLFDYSNTIAFKKCTKENEEKKKGVLEYELFKSCQWFEETGIWSNSGIETNKAIAFYEMINEVMAIIYKHNGTIFGGFVRDWIIRKDFSFKDIDIDFSWMCDRKSFIISLSNNYFLRTIDNVPIIISEVKNTTKFRICDHVKKYNNNNRKQYGDNNIIKIEIQHKKYPSLIIKMDLLLKTKFNNLKDFDINQLQYYDNKITCNGDYDLNTIVENIKTKKFTLLSYHGNIISDHKLVVCKKSKFNLINKSIELNVCCHSDCYCRNSKRGKQLQERINKMKNRGWKLQNPFCENAMCILSDDRKFNSYTIGKQNEFDALSYLTSRKFKLEDYNTELKNLTKKYKFELSQKEINISHNEIKTEKRKKDLVKRNTNKSHKILLLNYRKFDINKKNVFIEYDDNSICDEFEEEQ